MKLNESELPDFLNEMRSLIGQIKVSKGFVETFSLSYVIMVESDSDRNQVLPVANLLTEQAAKNYGIDLQIEVATIDEVNKAKELYKEYQAEKNGSFVL